jgi:MFS family permease
MTAAQPKTVWADRGGARRKPGALYGRAKAVSRLVDVVVPARLGRSFRWLLASSWITYLGDGITLAAGPLLVASQTRSPLAVAMAALLQRLPWLMFGLYAGVVADRVSRRAIVIATGLVRATILTLLAGSIISHHVDTAVVLAALFLFGVNETFADTATATLPPMLVDKRDLGIANSRTLAGMIAGNQLAGPPIGAALFAAGMALPFISEIVCVLAGVLLITQVQPPARAERTQATRVRDDIRQGWRWLWAHHAVRVLAIVVFAFNITFGAVWSVLVLYARERLGMGAVGFGLITTAMAVGGLAGTASYGWLERRVRLGVIMRAGLIIETLTYLALALTRWAWLAMIIFAIFGAHAFIWSTTSASVRQRAVPAEFQGRVSSVYLTGLVGGIVIGSAIGGAVASAWGVTAPFWFGFAGSASILAFIWRSLLQIAHADEDRRADDPAAQTPPRQTAQQAA